MADYFYDGQRDYIQRLNQLYTAFAAGPYGSLPSTGGTLTGELRLNVQGGQGALVTLTSPELANTGSAIIGVRGGELHFAIGSESIVRYGTGNDLAISAQGNALKLYAGGDVQLNAAVVIDGTRMSTARDVLPRTDNTYSLGSASLAYSVVYARTGAINTSDARLKTDFRDLTPAEIAAARDIARAIGIYRWRDAVEFKGDGAREHVGPTVQAVIEIMQAHGLDPFNYGFICHDTWAEQTIEHPAVEARPAVPASVEVPAVLDDDGRVLVAALPAQPGYPAIEARAAYTEVVLEAGDRYAFRYDELAMFIAAGQEARLAALEAR